MNEAKTATSPPSPKNRSTQTQFKGLIVGGSDYSRCRGNIDLVSVEEGDKDLLFVPENSKIVVFDAVSGINIGYTKGNYCLGLGSGG